MEKTDAWRLTDEVNTHPGKGDPFAAAVRATRMPMIITDPRQPDNPITFANEAFLALTGYKREEIQGKNCRFLQGPDTDMNDVAKVRQAIKDRRDIAIDLLNYRKDGTSFWNALYLSPVINEQGELLFYFASQLDVTERKNAELKVISEKERFEQAVAERTRELQATAESLQTALAAKTVLLHEVDHRVKNNMQIVASLISSQLRTIEDPLIKESLKTTLSRVEAMSTVHRRFYQSDNVARFDIADFAKDLVTDLIVATGRQDVVARFDLESIDVPAEKAAALALMVNELATNAIKHAFKDGRAGTLHTTVRKQGRDCSITIADDGPGAPQTATNGTSDIKGKTFGKDLISRLGRQLQAKTEWINTNPGTQVVITLPIEYATRQPEQAA